MDPMLQIAQAAIDQTPPSCRVTPEHAATIARHADMLWELGPEIVQSFYDTLYGHERTAQVFVDGERVMREQTLADWWKRTVYGPIDDTYWSWMAMVGLVHVLRQVTNPMMLSMAEHVASFVAEKSHGFGLPDQERETLTDAFRRVAAMTSSIIVYGYDHAVSSALFEVAGMPEALLARLRDQEVQQALTTARSELSAQSS